MRAFKPEIAKKNMKDSKFFEYFKSQGGTLRASSEDIRKQMFVFCKDLIYGNVVQDKYLPALMEDPRIIQEGMLYAETNLIENNMILQSLDCAALNKLPFTMFPEFSTVYNKYALRSQTYGIILHSLKDFAMSGNPDYLVSISVKLNTPFLRGVKQQYML